MFGSNSDFLYTSYEEYFQYTLEINPLATLLIDSRGSILYANDKACSLYGLTKDFIETLKGSCLGISIKGGLIKQAIGFTENKDAFQIQYRCSNGSIKNLEVYFNKIGMFEEEMFLCQIIDRTSEEKFGGNIPHEIHEFKVLVESSPSPIIVCDDYYVVFANKKAGELLKLENHNELISKFLLDFIHPKDIHNIVESVNEILTSKEKLAKKEYKLINSVGKTIDVEISAQYVCFNKRDCAQLVIRDITKEKKEIKRAVKIQEKSLINKFPLETKASLNRIWLPAIDVSGDFYELRKISDECIVGIVGDVCGKGTTAALNISAIRVLFNEVINLTHEPCEIIDCLNSKMIEHFKDDYVALLCFKLDFQYNLLEVVGAGINEFIQIKNNGNWRRFFVKGPFVGMFKDSCFEQIIINFRKGDKLLLYTDGMEFVFKDEEAIDKGAEMESAEYCKFLRKKLYKKVQRNDDSTCLVIDIL